MPPRVLIWMENRLEGKGCHFGRVWFWLSVGPSGDGGQVVGCVDISMVTVWSTPLCEWNGGGVRINATESPMTYVPHTSEYFSTKQVVNIYHSSISPRS